MRAVVHETHGDVDVLQLVTGPDPEPGPGEVLIAVRATSLNRLDVIQRAGPALLPGFRLPHVAGMDVAGEVVALGSGVSAPAVGARVVVNPALHCGECEWCQHGDDGLCPAVRVVGGNHPGGYADFCVVPASHVYQLPDRVSYEEAATIPTIWSTAWHALVEVAHLQIAETVLIHAAASGVSVAAIQLAKRMGARVVATAGTDAKCELALKLGADVTVNNRTDDVVAAARAITDGRGVDVVFDHVGPALFGPSLYSLRPRGRLVFCGSTTGTEASFSLPYAYHFGLQLLGSDPYSYAEFGRMLDAYWSAGFIPVIDSVYPLELAAVREAQRRLERGDVIGKVVLQP
ncbi:MAG TPA: zinc-binding dehydrogenase [Acidimicrobiales bacterium]|nr:zinc-binding dehydrogenase [Acidimicrobiales bacterium]